MRLVMSLAAFAALMLTALNVAKGNQLSATPARSLTVGEGFVDPLGFHDATPVFSWKLPDGVQKQQAYRIEASVGDSKWDSGWVESDRPSCPTRVGHSVRGTACAGE
jgi:alpha-L-rhamnosidase